MSDIMINGKMFKDGETIGKCGTCVEESPTWCDGCNEHQTAEAVVPLNDLLTAQAVLINDVLNKAKNGRLRANGHNCDATAACQSIEALITNTLMGC